MDEREFQRVVEEVRARVDIVEVIGKLIQLEKKGKDWRACCPFHREKTPSFYVVPDKSMYYCFGCGQKGDVFDFFREYQGMKFGDVLRYLADECGVVYQDEKRGSKAKERVAEEGLRAALERRIALRNPFVASDDLDEAYEELKNEESEKTDPYEPLEYPQGFYPIGAREIPTINAYAVTRGFSLETFQKYGFGGCVFGKYSGRLIVPCTYRGELVFFQGRDATGKADQKYDGPYGRHTKHYLFNLEQACAHSEVVICEGVFSAMRVGSHAVATFGNKISKEQIALLQRRGIRRVVLCYDADTWTLHPNVKNREMPPPIVKAVQRLLEAFEVIRVVRLFKGDPDENGTEKTSKAIQAAPYVHSMDIFSRMYGISVPVF